MSYRNMLCVLFVAVSAYICGMETSLFAEEEIRGDLLLLQGSSGTDEYGEMFQQWIARWQAAGERGNFRVSHIAPKSEGPDDQKQRVVAALQDLQGDAPRPVWIVLIGHGTFDGRSAKFNLTGPDLTAKELDQLLADVPRLTVIINCSSSSAPFLAELSQDNRILVTSTRSGDQINFSRYGDYLSQAIGDIASDLDKDKQTSLLEAFLSASRKTLEFYESDGRIPSEDALLDDNGDGRGTRASAFQGVRVVAKPEEEGVLLDGFRAHQFHLIANDTDAQLSPEVIAKRNELERQIELLRLKKNNLEEEAYYAQLEELFLQIAELVLEKQEEVNESKTDSP